MLGILENLVKPNNIGMPELLHNSHFCTHEEEWVTLFVFCTVLQNFLRNTHPTMLRNT